MNPTLKRLTVSLLAVLLLGSMAAVPALAAAGGGLDIEGALGEKTALQNPESAGEYEITLQVPGTSQKTQHTEIIIMADASDSISNGGNWPHFKNMVNALGANLLSDSTTLKLTLMGFGIGAKHAGTFNTPQELFDFMDTATADDFLQERSATNCEVGFTFVEEYINSSTNIDRTYVLYLSDAGANMTEKRFDISNWEHYTVSYMSYLVNCEVFHILEGSDPLAVTQSLFPTVCQDLIALRTVYAEDPEAAMDGINAAMTAMLDQAQTYGQAVTQAAMDLSGLSMQGQYSASQLEKVFQTYFRTTVGKEDPLYDSFMNFFYLCLLTPMNQQMPDDALRAAQASLSLQNCSKVMGLYHVCYSKSTNNWMNPAYAQSQFGITYTDKVTYLYGGNFGEAIATLENELVGLTTTIYKDVTVTDPMSQWVILEPDTIAIYDRSTKIYQYGQGWLTDTPPVTDENGVPLEPISLTLGPNGLYQIVWKVKTGNLLISDRFSLKYTVTLNEDAPGYVPGTAYPLNDPTTVSYTDENGQPQTQDIPVPQGVAYGVDYRYVSGTPGMELPETFVPVPVDGDSYGDQATVTAKAPEALTYADTLNDGIWTFQQWDADTKQIDGGNLTFTGTWTFAPNPYAVSYEYVSGTPGMELPEPFVPVPADGECYVDKTAVTAQTPEALTFTDALNDGVWSFRQWDADTKQIDRADLTFTGTWTFAPNTYAVSYEYVSGTPGMELPETFLPVPVDSSRYVDKTAVTAQAPEALSVADPVHDGVWTFQRWDADTKQIDRADLTFIGAWTFTANPEPPTLDPDTGDASPVLLWIALLVLSCTGIAGILLWNRKKRAR